MKHSINMKNNLVADDDENEEDDIEIIKQQKKHTKSSKTKRTSKSSTKEITTASFPEYKEVKPEDMEFIEFVLGDFHNMNELNQFKKMTSLSLINQNISSLNEVIKNIPVKENMVLLCLNQNLIGTMKGVNQLPNLEKLQLNFNQIERIDDDTIKLNHLRVLWLCENKIKKIENIPNTIEELWLANNQIENIPKEIENFQSLYFFNISGNFIMDFKDIFILQNLSKLSKLYLSDVNFGDNPICQYSNYRSAILHLIPKLDILDQIVISQEEKKDVENMYAKKYLFYKNKIRHLHKICKMVFQLLKTNKLFVDEMKIQQARFFSQRKKMLEFAKYEKEVLKVENETKIEDIEKEVNASQDKLNICLKLIEFVDSNFKFIKQYISELNNFAIVANFFEMETAGNFKIEPGNVTLKWTKSCIDLMKSRTPLDFFEKNKIKSILYGKIFKILNKKSKLLFDALYDNLIEENGKFGDEKKYFDFFFLILPKGKYNYFDILSMIFEDSNNNYLLTDSLAEFDAKMYNENNKSKFIAIICKCATFDNMIEKVKISSLTPLDNYDSILAECKKTKTSKNIVQLSKDKVNYYYYTTKGLVIPEYIIEYEYESKDEQNDLNYEGGFISSFGMKLNMIENYGSIFNMCSKHLFSPDSKTYMDGETINKYSTCKFGEFNELESSMIFFAKNSILAYILKCFKYQSVDEYKNEINKINEKLNEITNLKFTKITSQALLSSEDREKINITDITKIDLFNLKFNDEILTDFINKIIAQSESDEDLKVLRNKIVEISIAKNEIENIDISLLCEAFPNLSSIDLSHNSIHTISYTKDVPNQIKKIDISFNTISDFTNVITVIDKCPNLMTLSFYANPYSKAFHHLVQEPSDDLFTPERKELIQKTYKEYNEQKNSSCQTLTVNSDTNGNNRGIKNFDVLFDCYSIGDKYHEFSNNLYFREKVSNENNYKSLMLSKRKLTTIPIVEGHSDVQLLYINLNKISQITNLNQFKNLIELYIQNNKITKIENLPWTLIKLDISNNELQSLDGISQADKLKWLNIENNAIQSIAQIITLPNLVEFYSAGNFISNIKECYQLRQLAKLEIVDISSNEVCRTVHEIRLGMIYYCQRLKNFNRVGVDENERNTAIEFFTGKLTNEILEKKLGSGYDTTLIRELDLSSLKLKDEIGMFSKENYPVLSKLNLSRNLFTTFQIFGMLPSLIELNLNYNLITCIINKNEKKSLKGIFGLTKLESLELSGNSINNLSGIQCLRTLKILVLRENNINKIEAINKMNDLTFLDVSFNKIRSVDRTQIGTLPSLQIFLCDNNFLKNVNGFVKLEALQTLSFENNKIYDYSSIEKLALLENLRDFSILNNPLTKLANYRTRMISTFGQLIKLDGTEITTEEKEMIQMDIQMGDYQEDPMQNYFNNGFQGKKNGSYNYNMQKLQDKNLKRVNFVQLDLLNPNLVPFGGVRASSPKNVINLPHIKPFNYGYNYTNKPPTSDSKKRLQSNINKGNNGLKVGSYMYSGMTTKKGYSGSMSNKDYYGFVASALSGDLTGKTTQYIPQSKK